MIYKTWVTANYKAHGRFFFEEKDGQTMVMPENWKSAAEIKLYTSVVRLVETRLPPITPTLPTFSFTPTPARRE